MGFEVGGDDYLVKPFSPRELILRVQVLLKRAGAIHSVKVKTISQIVIGNMVIDRERQVVMVDHNDAQLTKMEYEVLNLLVDRRGRLQSRKQLLNDCWDIAADVTTRTVDTHIKRVRQKLGVMGAYIETRRGFGYRFKD